MIKHAIVAGSFDPITNGHVWLIEQALSIASFVTVVVAANPDKKYFFTEAERVKQVTTIVNKLSTWARVDVLGHELLVEYAVRQGATHLVRGIRNAIDLAYESNMAELNKSIQPLVSTVYVTPPSSLVSVSSTIVKTLVKYDNWKINISKYVDQCVVDDFSAKLQVGDKLVTPKNGEKNPGFLGYGTALQHWTDGEKVVFDYANVFVGSLNCRVIRKPSIDEVLELCNSSPMHTTFYVAGSVEQYQHIQDIILNRSVIHLMITS